MVEAISTSTVQTGNLGYLSQMSARIDAAAASAPAVSIRDLTFSRIYVDSLRDVSILQYQNGDGEVIRQYPSESQIRAFKSAEQLRARLREDVQQQARHEAYSKAVAQSSKAVVGPAPPEAEAAAQPSKATFQVANAAYTHAAASGGQGQGNGGGQQVFA